MSRHWPSKAEVADHEQFLDRPEPSTVHGPPKSHSCGLSAYQHPVDLPAPPNRCHRPLTPYMGRYETSFRILCPKRRDPWVTNVNGGQTRAGPSRTLLTKLNLSHCRTLHYNAYRRPVQPSIHKGDGDASSPQAYSIYRSTLLFFLSIASCCP